MSSSGRVVGRMSPYKWDQAPERARAVLLTAASGVKFAIFLSVFCHFSNSGKRHGWMDQPCFQALEANIKG